MTDIDLKLILDSKANIYANLTTKKLALMTDDDTCLVANNGGTFQKYLYYETSDGVTETSVETGTKIFTSTATTGLANSQLDNALSEINTDKMDINNGQGFGLTELNELEVDTTVTADTAKIGEGAQANAAVFGHTSWFGTASEYGYQQLSTGDVLISSASGTSVSVRVANSPVANFDITNGVLIGQIGTGTSIPLKMQRTISGSTSNFTAELDNTNQGVIFNSVYNSGAPTVPYEWQVNGVKKFEILDTRVAISDKLEIGDGTLSDNDTLLEFKLDRSWAFKQNNDGSNARLELNCLNADKAFYITDVTRTNSFRFSMGNGATTGMSFDLYNNSTRFFRLQDGVLNIQNLPTSSAGLVTGDIWNNSGVLNIV